MATGAEYRFKFDAYTPETMPMARLAEYMADLAQLFGETAAVHFVRIDSGSVVLVHKVEREAVPKVEGRIERIRHGDGPPDAMSAYHRLNQKLRKDAGSGEIQRATGAQILQFPGSREIQTVSFAAFTQEGTIDGIVIKLGGRQDPVPVHIESGSIIYSVCHASRAMARQLKHHMFDDELRFFGSGRWFRDDAGTWTLQRFTIASFEPLDSRPLTDVVAGLRAIRGSEWEGIKDPWAELRAIRGEDTNGHGAGG